MQCFFRNTVFVSTKRHLGRCLLGLPLISGLVEARSDFLEAHLFGELSPQEFLLDASACIPGAFLSVCVCLVLAFAFILGVC